MVITWLIGNGFDVGMGMKSKFKDFFPIYQALCLDKRDNIRQLSLEISKDHDTWADFEKELGQYTKNFNKQTKGDFLAQVKDFEKEFTHYLTEHEKKLSFSETEAISKTMINGLSGFYKNDILEPRSSTTIQNKLNNRTNENIIYHFINFNYTSVLEKCLETLPQGVVQKRKWRNSDFIDKIGHIVHVHGIANKLPIIGVNDKSQIANKELAEDDTFTKYIIKPTLTEILRQNNDTRTSNIISQSDIICVYGMSFGETDKKWWQQIINWLAGSNGRQLIIFDYDSEYTSSTSFGFIEKEDYYYDKLNTFAPNNSVKVENLRNQIHIAIHKNIFEMDLMKESRETSEKAIEMLKEHFSNNNTDLVKV